MNEFQKQRFAEALERLAGDSDLLCGMAMLVADDARQALQDLADAVAGHQLPRITATAHQLKGMLSTFETESPLTELQQVIMTARASDAALVEYQFYRIQPALSGLIEEIAELCTSSG